jgi:predicted ATP-grasp superfamily ATP-dependent carboligase
MPNNHGTLAAVRALGRHGVPVTTADPSLFSIASASRYTSAAVRCPPVRDTDRFIDWLLEFGKQQERHVLLPTCDDTVWLYALHRERLSEHFHLALPSVDVLHQLLNKRLLAERARAVGLDTPRTWFPRSLAELGEIARAVTYPVLVKPITQVLFAPRSKGLWVHSAAELLQRYPKLARDPYGRAVTDYDASVSLPMVQEFYPHAFKTGVYSISGYARGGRVLAAKAARKVLQWPRRFGVGVCFEEAPLHAPLVAGLARLVEDARFQGTFEAEFVEDGERRALIDFNPRFYNQMGFDVARGSPLPLLAYEDALRDTDVLAAPVPEPAASPADLPRIYVHGVAAKVLLGTQRLSGVVSRSEFRKWQSWYERHRFARVDAVDDGDDRAPALVDSALFLKECVRHPWRFVKVIALDA